MFLLIMLQYRYMDDFVFGGGHILPRHNPPEWEVPDAPVHQDGQLNHPGTTPVD